MFSKITFKTLLISLICFASCQQEKNSVSQSWAFFEEMGTAIEYEMEDKSISSLSIAIVKGQEVIYQEAFGFQDLEKTQQTQASSTYKIGSVSKLFTDIAVMQMVENGTLDLDTSITTYLPDFRPHNPSQKPITLRQLMSHRSGLLREPGIGHYFDDSEPTLSATVNSIKGSQLVYEPEERIKYSNAAIAVVGKVVEEISQTPFSAYLKQTLLEPLGMLSSDFAPSEVVSKNLVDAEMWTYDHRKFPAPLFELGMAPAGSMYSTVGDLATFIKTLTNHGKAPNGHKLLTNETLSTMWQPQFDEGAKTGIGLGFIISDFEGNKLIGHGGAIYGYSTELLILPEQELGVIVMSNLDVSNTVAKRLGKYALELELSSKDTPKPYQKTDQVRAELIKELPGKYTDGNFTLEITEEHNELFLWMPWSKLRLRQMEANQLIVDDRSDYGMTVELADDALVIDDKTFEKASDTKPEELAESLRPYIGEYGWDHNILYITERFGQLCALVEWTELDLLSPVEPDVFAFPNYNMYHGENITFRRDENGKVIGLDLTDIHFPRRLTDIETGKTFVIEPLKPIEELREIALSSNPPEEEEKRAPELVSLRNIHPGIKYDIRYASTNNFMQNAFYESPGAFLQRPAAEALGRVQTSLEKEGYGLLIHDAYRPWSVTKMFWDATPEKWQDFVANPQNGSRHNRGCAVDLTLYNLKTGAVIETVGGYDEFSDRSFPHYPGGTEIQRYYRELLRRHMEEQNFEVYEWEWWHFDFKEWNKYPILDLSFEDLAIL